MNMNSRSLLVQISRLAILLMLGSRPSSAEGRLPSCQWLCTRNCNSDIGSRCCSFLQHRGAHRLPVLQRRRRKPRTPRLVTAPAIQSFQRLHCWFRQAHEDLALYFSSKRCTLCTPSRRAARRIVVFSWKALATEPRGLYAPAFKRWWARWASCRQQGCVKIPFRDHQICVQRDGYPMQVALPAS